MATTAPVPMPVPVTAMPTATPANDDTAVTAVAPDATVAVGVTVALKQCPPEKSSLLKLVLIAVTIPAIIVFLLL